MNSSIQQLQSGNEREDRGDLARRLVFIHDNRWLITGIALIVTLLGVAYAFLAQPLYEANLLVQVEDKAGLVFRPPGEVSSGNELKAGAASEIEVLRSRLIISQAVDSLHLFIQIQPDYFPVIGASIARRNHHLSQPGFMGFGGYAWGAERAEVAMFNVPEELESREFSLLTGKDGAYVLERDSDGIHIQGRIGETITVRLPQGWLELRVDRIDAKPGIRFRLTRQPRIETIEKLQEALKILERGKQSGIIGVSLLGHDPRLTSAILREIGNDYIAQNEDRKAQDAEKSLAFLNRQLPELKRELERAETRFNELRHRLGTIDLGQEAKTLLQQSADAQARMVDLRQRKEELMVRYQEEHPAVQTLNQQMQVLYREMDKLDAGIRRLPSVEQEVLRLTRDVKVNTDVYTAVLSMAQQLRLLTASKTGNARLLDTPVLPVKPVKPKRPMIIAVAALLGTVLGVLAALARKIFYGAIDDPQEIRRRLGLPVVATIPYSARQEKMHAQPQLDSGTLSILAHQAPSDIAVESLRRIRAWLQFEMRHACNNIIVITSPTPAVGKSFMAVNFSVVLASIGKRVLLIDADLRRGHLHRYFGLQRHGGLTDAIAADAMAEQVIHKSVVEHVDFLSTGKLPSKPAEVLAHENVSSLLRRLSGRYDFILIDTAPVIAVADALVLGPHAGTLFNVVLGGVTTSNEIEETVKRLNQAGVRVTGTVFNDRRAGTIRYGSEARYLACQYEVDPA